MRRAPLFLGLLALVAAGCGGKTKTLTETTTVPATTAPSAEKTALRVYFLKDGKVQPVAREVPRTQAVAKAALDQLYAGPTDAESQLGLTTALGSGMGISSPRVFPQSRVLRLTTSGTLTKAFLAQVVYTLTQFPSVEAVEVDGRRYTRADFEDETPIIAVESPLPFEHVTSPLRVTGTANTFEATFDYDLVDAGGNVVAHHFVTATSGSGQRGTFDFTVPFSGAKRGLGKLVVYEVSAKDGSRIHQSEIPLALAP